MDIKNIDWAATDALCFDMDGTLWDAVDSYCEIWNRCFRKVGMDRVVARQELIACMGLNLREILRRLCGGVPMPDATRLLISASPASFNRLGCEVGKDMNPNAFDYRLYLYDIASHRTKPLLPGFKPSVGNYQWSRGDGQIYFVADDASGRGIFSLNPESGAVKSYRIPIECVSGFSMAVGQRKNPDFMAFGKLSRA